MSSIRPFAPRDRATVLALWAQALPDWPVQAGAFDEITAGAAWVAEAAGALVGYLATSTDGSEAAITVVLVAPDYQHQGVGSELLATALTALETSGVAEVGLGAGGQEYFWPGVPVDLPVANAFFDARGWSRQAVVADLRGDIRGFKAPREVMRRAGEEGVVFSYARPEDAAQVRDFEQRHFPEWAEAYEGQLAESQGVLIGWTLDEDIVATATIEDASSYAFAPLLPTPLGAFGCVGVDPAVRGQGIGLALCARASELLAARGYAHCFVGYTHLADWYAQLGFETWRSYRMGKRRLED
jgi:ribosomal protein S18 acetylase RimI-like enzyme